MRIINGKYYFTAREAGDFLGITNKKIMKIGRGKGWIEGETGEHISEYANENMAGVHSYKILDYYTKVFYMKHYFSRTAILTINREYNFVDEFDLEYNIRRKIQEYMAKV